MEDLPVLAAALLRKSIERNGVPAVLTPEAMQLINNEDWPGNVRELENAIERATILCQGGRILPTDLIETGGIGSFGQIDGESLEAVVCAAETTAIRQALAASSGNRESTAEKLGISVRSLFYKLKKYDIDELQ